MLKKIAFHGPELLDISCSQDIDTVSKHSLGKYILESDRLLLYAESGKKGFILGNLSAGLCT
jgi:hypothetical protein